ncbi:MAG: HRDC domain-containing protein [Prevotellaceae bacterium]|jgi:superfamily II DNA helicase RecQ|nr:HRDC domain-containing protein [Prevotellaceae bacterium]
MQIKIFNIPIADNGTLQDEFNRFLAANRVLEIEQHFFQNEKGSYWSFCVRYLVSSIPYSGSGKEKIDYKQILNEQEFGIFSALREIRKQIAAQDAVPAYAVFTDEELAGIAKLPELTAPKLVSIKGIGDKKVQKYGKQMIDMYNQKNTTNEKGELFN